MHLPSCVLLFFSAASQAFGWGCDGHQIISLMVRAQLKPAVSTALDSVLQAAPISPSLNRFCREHPVDPLADSSTWADDMRTAEGNGNWHFVDLPLSATRVPKHNEITAPCGNAIDPKTLCITEAIELQLRIFRARASSSLEKGNALRYLIHLIEDIHQPLHDTSNNDNGGNCTSITFPDEERPTNLHSIWDTRLIARDMFQRHPGQAAYASEIAAEFARQQKGWAKEKLNPKRWAWEQHLVATNVAYPLLVPRIPIESPGPVNCEAERAKTEALGIKVGDSYLAIAIPVVREQMAKAAARLASFLNRTL